jgi:hypothetical protein
MLWVGDEPMIPASERAKTVHALDRSATVTGWLWFSLYYFKDLGKDQNYILEKL